MSEYNPPTLADVIAIRDDPRQHNSRSLKNGNVEGQHNAAVQRVENILNATRGRSRLASEQRDLNRAQDDVAMCAEVMRLCMERDNQAAVLRAGLQHIIDPGGSRLTGNRFGDEIRQAIDDVQNGRAQAFVDAPEARLLTESGTAGYGVQNHLMQPVSTLRAKSIVMSLPGLRTIPMDSDRARFPRIGGATVGVTAEGVSLTAAATVNSVVDVLAMKAGVLETLTSELVEDYSADALAIFGENLLNQLALKVDLGLLEGNGAGDFLGIRNTPGVNSTSVAATATLAKFRTADYELRNDNGTPQVWVMHPRTWNTLSGIVTGITSDLTTLLEPNPQLGPTALLGLPVAFSSQITLTEGTLGSWAAVLDTSQLLVCERRPARLEFSQHAGFSTDTVMCRATWRGNLAVLNPEAISILTDVRT